MYFFHGYAEPRVYALVVNNKPTALLTAADRQLKAEFTVKRKDKSQSGISPDKYSRNKSLLQILFYVQLWIHRVIGWENIKLTTTTCKCDIKTTG